MKIELRNLIMASRQMLEATATDDAIPETLEETLRVAIDCAERSLTKPQASPTVKDSLTVQPAPAEQGEGLIEAIWELSAHCGIYSPAWKDEMRKLIASRPQPEVKVVPMAMLRELVNHGYRQLGDKTIKQIVAKHMPGYTVKE
jgi:hypothetical protein